MKSIDELRTMYRRVVARNVDNLLARNHGNSWSVYFDDPEGNNLEVYLDSPFHVPQPFGEYLDFDLSDFVTWPLIKKSVKAFWTFNKRMPCAAPQADLTEDRLNEIQERVCSARHPLKTRTTAQAGLDGRDDAEEDLGDADEGDAADWPWPVWSKAGARANIIEYGDRYTDQMDDPQ